jgi:hypothetical protein
MSRGRYGWQGGDLIGPAGELRDYIPKAGDLPPDAFVRGLSTRQRWGRRVQLRSTTYTVNSNPQSLLSPRATLIATQPLARDYPINIQMRFAPAGIAPGNPVAMPNSASFSYINPVVLGATLRITLRRGIDPNAPVGVEEFDMPFGTANDMVPFDVITAKELGVDVELIGTDTSLWVEAWATIVHDVERLNLIPGYGFTQGPLGGAGLQVTAVADPAFATLLVARKARTQFFIVNTSAANMAVLFNGTPPQPTSGGPTFGPPARATFVLPGGSFAVYESPYGGYNGVVTATWEGAAPTGGALVTEGANWL